MASIGEVSMIPGNVYSPVTTGKQNINQTDGFQNIMENLAVDVSARKQENVSGLGSEIEKKDPEFSKTTGSKDGNEDKLSLSEEHTNVKETSNEQVSESDDTAAKVLQEAEEEIKTITADKLGISVEELEEILAQMGLTAFELFNPENVSNLVAQVLGEGDLLALVTDENLSGIVMDLNSMLASVNEALGEELSVTPEGFASLVEEFYNRAIADEVDYDSLNTEDTMPESMDTEDIESYAGEQSVNRDVEQNPSEDTASKDSSNPDFSNENGKSNISNPTTTDNAKSNISETRNDQSNENMFGQNITTSDLVPEVGPEELPESFGTRANEIIDQINSLVRQNVSTGVTELEMQLNPENLGTVGLYVSSREGVVTAQFTTQNEAVKAVMEAQVMVLKENLEQQGVKVEAIEVTVASHGFEQNLEQGNDTSDQMNEEQERLRRATRKIDLGEFANPGDLDSLDESEQVTVEMMQADGNSMDYKV